MAPIFVNLQFRGRIRIASYRRIPQPQSNVIGTTVPMPPGRSAANRNGRRPRARGLAQPAPMVPPFRR